MNAPDHKCLKAADERLAAKNTRLAMAFCVGPKDQGSYLMIATEKVNSKQRGQPAKLMASYCPFCGDKL